MTDTLIAVLLSVVMLLISVVNIVIPDAEFSSRENRTLAQFPVLTWDNLSSGRFTRQVEDYISDQFVGKSWWVSLKSDLERYSFKAKNNGIFFGKQDYLLEDFRKPGSQFDENLAMIRRFAEGMNGLPVHLMLIPGSVWVHEDKLPWLATPDSQLDAMLRAQSEMGSKGDTIDISQALLNKRDEYIYFRTDHHWTMRGAYYAYREMAGKLGFTPLDWDDFDVDIISHEFYGTFYSKANNSHVSPDYLELIKPKDELAVSVIYRDTGKTEDSFFDLSHLQSRDKYALFLDGNHDQIVVKTNQAKGKKLLLVKDSYSNCLIPFLAQHYEEIHVLDLRFFKGSVHDYAQESEVTDVLFSYSVSMFAADKNIRNLR